VLDETAHLAVGLLVARVRPPDERVGVVTGAMAIDADHVPHELLGHEALRAGARGRPYPHTVFTPLALAAAARRWPFWRGAMIGVAAHLARDLTDPTCGVKLLWPLSHREMQVPQPLYALAIGALAARPSTRPRA